MPLARKISSANAANTPQSMVAARTASHHASGQRVGPQVYRSVSQRGPANASPSVAAKSCERPIATSQARARSQHAPWRPSTDAEARTTRGDQRYPARPDP